MYTVVVHEVSQGEWPLCDKPVNHVPGPLWLVERQNMAAAPHHHLSEEKTFQVNMRC